MGWWADTIMGGDTPLDYLGEIAGKLGAKFDYNDESTPAFHGHHITREMLEKRGVAGKLLKLAEGRWQGDVFLQVIGAVYLWAGAKMTAKLRDAVIRGAREDEWMREEGTCSSRGREIENFIEAVEQNWQGGSSVELRDPGLFDKFAEMLG